MVTFKATIKKFSSQGEKTGWTFIEVPVDIAQQLKPGNKKSFRVKGALDDLAFEMLSLVPMGGGNYILALNASLRKQLRKSLGNTLSVKMEVDERSLEPSADFIECLVEEPGARAAFDELPKSHQHYFGNWINAAKTEATRARRIAAAINALAAGLSFGEMIRKIQQERKELGRNS